jgi:hypothetical protein
MGNLGGGVGSPGWLSLYPVWGKTQPIGNALFHQEREGNAGSGPVPGGKILAPSRHFNRGGEEISHELGPSFSDL